MKHAFKRQNFDTKKEKRLEETKERFKKLYTLPLSPETKIQCSWPIHVGDIYKTYFLNFSTGLSLYKIEDEYISEKRLTKSAKSQLESIYEHHCDFHYDCAVGRKDAGMKKVFSKKENYYRKPVTYIMCKNIKAELERLL